MKISSKIILITIISICTLISTSILLKYFSNKELHEEIIREHKVVIYQEITERLKVIMDIGYQLLKSTHENQVKMGNSYEYMMEVIVKRFSEELIFFEDKTGYIFAYKSDGTRVAIVGRKGLGENFMHLKDSNGNFFLKDIIDVAKRGGGIAEYYFPKPNETKPSKKIAYSVYYKPLDLVIGTGIYVDSIDKDIQEFSDEIEKDMQKELINTIIYLVILMIIALISTYVLVLKSLVNPLKNIVKNADELSSTNGDLTKLLPISGKDEIADLSNSINKFINKVHGTVSKAKELSNENASVSNELSSTSLNVGKAVQETMEVVDGIAINSKNISSNAYDKTLKAKEDIVVIQETIKSINSTSDKIKELANDINKIAESESLIASNIEVLSKDATKIQGVLTVIDDIAEQTNLLSLNAAIEAARAGEHGRGFAVVAEEVRKLAEKTQSSLVEINDTINVVINGIKNSSKDIVKNSKSILELSNEASDVLEVLKVLQTDINKVDTVSSGIVKDFNETGNLVSKMSEDIVSINNLSSGNARSVEEIAAAAEHMYRMTEELQAKLQEFKT